MGNNEATTNLGSGGKAMAHAPTMAVVQSQPLLSELPWQRFGYDLVWRRKKEGRKGPAGT